jgi:NAD(P)-dependent dehydrogenase (short-subunit alcohol dehydrogenase family)
MVRSLVNKVAVVTGAASGLGKEISRLGCRLGMKVVLVDYNAEALEKCWEELASSSSTSGNLAAVVADVSKMKDVENVSRTAQEKFGTPNLVFNNAGIARAGFAWEHSPEEWQWFLGINLMGVVHGINAFTPIMLAEAKKNPDFRGRIINTASMAGLVSMPASSMYNVSKHAVVTLTETLYHDLKIVTDQVSASVLCPFYVPTNIAKCPTPPGHSGDKLPSQVIGEAFTAKATSAGKVSAEDVAKIVFDSIEKDQFYIYSHQGALTSYEARAEDIMTAANPRDPYATKPEVGKMLRKALKDSYNK